MIEQGDEMYCWAVQRWTELLCELEVMQVRSWPWDHMRPSWRQRRNEKTLAMEHYEGLVRDADRAAGVIW